MFNLFPTDLTIYGIYQFRIYNIIFFTYLTFLIYVSIEGSGINTIQTLMNGTFIFLIAVIIYYFLQANYGFYRIFPKTETYKLDEVTIFRGVPSDLKRSANSGLGFTAYLRLNITPKTFKTYSKIAEKVGQYQIFYDGKAGDLIIKVPTTTESVETGDYDNVFTLKNYPLQKWNHLFLIARQNVVTVYLNDRRHSFLMDYYGKVINSNTYIGQEGGVEGSVSRYLYFDFPLEDYQVRNIYKTLRRENNYLFGFIPYKTIW
jgi:hypothetical protein